MICLITPPSPFLLDERVFPHIGILKIASVLESKNIAVDFIDLAGIDNYLEVISDYVKETKNKVFGITATTPQLPFATKISLRIKELMPESTVILGGAHVSLMNSARKSEIKKNITSRACEDIEKLGKLFDIIVAGDGEKAIFDALKINKGIIDADEIKSSLFLTDDDLDDLPLPARHLIDLNSYHYNIDGHKATSLICQLGCPFKCAFCGGRNSSFLRRIRTRSSDVVIDEIEQLHKTYGYTGFMFYDDELNVNKKFEEFLEKLIVLQEKLDKKFTFRGFVKAELFTQRQADLMYKSGFRWLLTGFESGDPRILLNIEKQATVEDNDRCISYAKNAGLKVKALMSIGHAGESFETVNNTKQWLLRVKPEEFDCTIITTYPGSPYFDNATLENGTYVYVAKKSGDKLYQKSINYEIELNYYKGDPDGGYVSYVWTDFMSSNDLIVARDSLEREVRATLGIAFNPGNKLIKYEHSMGQGGIPDSILRKSSELWKQSI